MRSCSDQFQSTPPRGGRQILGGDRDAGICVSIHAPARGATSITDDPFRIPPVSIHAPARGATCSSDYACGDCVFQSTPPRGGRHVDYDRSMAQGGFNPRPRAGGDANEAWMENLHKEFQSTPPRGGRHSTLTSPTGQKVSIHAPARGATTSPTAHAWDTVVSIHAPARGATNGGGPAGPSYRVSIHAPARGATEDSSGT